MSSMLESSRILTKASALALRLVRVQFVRVRVPGASLITGRQLSASLEDIAALVRYAARRNSGYRYVRTELVSVPFVTSCGEEHEDASSLSRAEFVQVYRRVRWPFEVPNAPREAKGFVPIAMPENGIARIVCTEFTPGISRDVNSTQTRSRSHGAKDFSRPCVSCCKSASYAFRYLLALGKRYVGTARHFWTARSLGGIVKGGATPLVFISPFDK